MMEQITIRSLLEVRSGFVADDDNPDSHGNENRMIPAIDWVRFRASGNGGEKIYVIPETDMVVAIKSSPYNPRRGQMRSRQILRNVLLSI